MDVRLLIRRAARADAAALERIERRCFGDPWSENSFREAIDAAHGLSLVGEEGDGIVAYLIARSVLDEAEILNLAVAPEHRRQGAGAALLGRALEETRSAKIREVFLEVRESNRSARRLYERSGFRAVGYRPRYYRNPAEDALVLRLALAGFA